MGWDAFSEPRANEAQKEIFKKASDKVRSLAGTVDGYLDTGALDCSDCAKMIERATGESCFDDWSPEQVKEFNEASNWNFEVKEDLKWAYYSAKFFLEACEEANLGIRFTY